MKRLATNILLAWIDDYFGCPFDNLPDYVKNPLRQALNDEYADEIRTRLRDCEISGFPGCDEAPSTTAQVLRSLLAANWLVSQQLRLLNGYEYGMGRVHNFDAVIQQLEAARLEGFDLLEQLIGEWPDDECGPPYPVKVLRY